MTRSTAITKDNYPIVSYYQTMTELSKIALNVSPYLFIIMVLSAVPMALLNFNHWYILIPIMGLLGFLYIMFDAMRN